MPTQEPWSEERTRAIVSNHTHLEGPLMPILHAVQEAFGFVPEEAVPVIAEELNLSRAEVHGVVTFYHDFRQDPAGRTVIKVCRAEACQAMGCESLVKHAEDRLGVDWAAPPPTVASLSKPSTASACAPRRPRQWSTARSSGGSTRPSSTRSSRRPVHDDQDFRSARCCRRRLRRR